MSPPISATCRGHHGEPAGHVSQRRIGAVPERLRTPTSGHSMSPTGRRASSRRFSGEVCAPSEQHARRQLVDNDDRAEVPAQISGTVPAVPDGRRERYPLLRTLRCARSVLRRCHSTAPRCSYGLSKVGSATVRGRPVMGHSGSRAGSYQATHCRERVSGGPTDLMQDSRRRRGIRGSGPPLDRWR
jgi:hypothetical protein